MQNKTLQIQLLLLQRSGANIAQHLERSCWHHRQLIRALELRDGKLAEAQMQIHMRSARDAVLGATRGPGPDRSATRRFRL